MTEHCEATDYCQCSNNNTVIAVQHKQSQEPKNICSNCWGALESRDINTVLTFPYREVPDRLCCLHIIKVGGGIVPYGRCEIMGPDKSVHARLQELEIRGARA